MIASLCIEPWGVRWCILPVLLSVVFSTAAAQGVASVPGSPQPPPIQIDPPDHVLFRFFFMNVLSVDSFADSLKASGKDDAMVRFKFMREAKLTPAENTLLITTAKRCTAELDAHERNQIAPAVQRLKQQYPRAAKASALPPEAAAQLAGLQRAQEQIVAACIETLKAGMGPERFQKLYGFVRGTESPRIRQAPAPLPQKKQP